MKCYKANNNYKSDLSFNMNNHYKSQYFKTIDPKIKTQLIKIFIFWENILRKVKTMKTFFWNI